MASVTRIGRQGPVSSEVFVDRVAGTVRVGATVYDVRHAAADVYEVSRAGIPIGRIVRDGLNERVSHDAMAQVGDMRAIYIVARAWFEDDSIPRFTVH